MLLVALVACSFSLLYSILLSEYIIICLAICHECLCLYTPSTFLLEILTLNEILGGGSLGDA